MPAAISAFSEASLMAGFRFSSISFFLLLFFSPSFFLSICFSSCSCGGGISIPGIPPQSLFSSVENCSLISASFSSSSSLISIFPIEIILPPPAYEEVADGESVRLLAEIFLSVCFGLDNEAEERECEAVGITALLLVPAFRLLIDISGGGGVLMLLPGPAGGFFISGAVVLISIGFTMPDTAVATPADDEDTAAPAAAFGGRVFCCTSSSSDSSSSSSSGGGGGSSLLSSSYAIGLGACGGCISCFFCAATAGTVGAIGDLSPPSSLALSSVGGGGTKLVLGGE
mmetsp:Transcript_25875/g.41638  ORF Transcript_25875/g.41638 Transcript_25875/m.41638 type:complete len:285 (-) Transcript_25875:1260-2114(-)